MRSATFALVLLVFASTRIASADPIGGAINDNLSAGASGVVVLTYNRWNSLIGYDFLITTVAGLDAYGNVLGQTRFSTGPDGTVEEMDGATYDGARDYGDWYQSQPNANWVGPGSGIYSGGPLNNVVGSYLVRPCMASGDCYTYLTP